MNIDSVRELKSRLALPIVAPRAAPGVVSAEVVAREIGGAGRRAGGAASINFAAQSLRSIEHVQRTVALGIARKRGADYRLAVRLQRRALEDSDYLARVHKAAKGEVDVRYVGRISKRAIPWYQKRCRPIRPGCSIGHFKITAGTLGCFVEDTNGVLHVLSNNHVLANENGAKKGDLILQPGPIDGGTNPQDIVGTLARFVRLKKTQPNLVDCALSTVQQGIAHVASIKGIGKVTDLFDGDIRDGLHVQKLGRTTGHTRGRITAFELDNVVVAYDIGNLRFDDQIEIEGAGSASFSDGGDSGSLILAGNEGIALLFAGGDQGGTNGRGLTYANPLGTVLQKLRVTLV